MTARTWTKVFLIVVGGIAGLVLALAIFINTGPGRRTVAAIAWVWFRRSVITIAAS